jgi:hypothetical protein
MEKVDDIIQLDANSIVVSNEGNANIVPYLFSLDRIEKSNCILCHSEYRDEVEEMYDDQKDKKNYLAIKKSLKDKHNFDISRDALRNHLVRHYSRINNNIALQEYTEEVQQWVNMQTNKVAAMKARIAILEREYFNIANQSDDIDLMERRKNADCLKKLAETILLYENKLGEYQEEIKPVNLIFNQLKIIVNDEMQYVNNATSKKLVSKILNRLKESCGSMLVE